MSILFYRVRSLNISPTPSLAEDLQQTNNVSVNAFSLPGQSPRVIRAILPRDETCEDDDADEIGNYSFEHKSYIEMINEFQSFFFVDFCLLKNIICL